MQSQSCLSRAWSWRGPTDYSIGNTYARHERTALYADTYRRAKQVVLRLLALLRPDLAKRTLGT